MLYTKRQFIYILFFNFAIVQYTLANTEVAIKIGQSRETDNIGHTRRWKTKQSLTHYLLDTTMRKQAQIT